MEVNCTAHAVRNTTNPGAEVDDQFRVEIHYRQILATARKNASGEVEEEDSELVLNESTMTFWHPKDEFVSQYDAAWDIISIWLEDLEIPLQAYPKVIDEIISCARQMLQETCRNPAHTSLDMEVHIGVIEVEWSGGDQELEDQVLDEEEEDDDNGSMDLETLTMVPASTAAVERLEKVELKAVEGVAGCVICLGEFTVGSQVSVDLLIKLLVFRDHRISVKGVQTMIFVLEI
ncbi:hypothetical protein Ancab_022509 [Ancistrocladus abbreviatus]